MERQLTTTIPTEAPVREAEPVGHEPVERVAQRRRRVVQEVADRGILYTPDYVVNSGGVIQVADELAGFNFDRARAATEQIFTTTAKVLAIADSDGVPPSVAADRLAERRMSDVGRLRGIWLGTMGSA